MRSARIQTFPSLFILLSQTRSSTQANFPLPDPYYSRFSPMHLPPASPPRFGRRDSPGPDAKPSPIADPAPHNSSLSSPDATAIQTLVFGLFTALLAMIAVFISYRQLQIMLRRRKARVAISSLGRSEHDPEAELMQLTAPTHPTPRPNQMFTGTPLLLERVYTFQQYSHICFRHLFHQVHLAHTSSIALNLRPAIRSLIFFVTGLPSTHGVLQQQQQRLNVE
ncbi:hypothetical protein QBC34DRAFT_414638 [Podospora aff. communis PSN243]|uniref:Uncharacterized protein n=1 Tax=Podospora aff. communis PSN243 TaxID=3040156 RepID=A0AAV9G8U0_9PEZI|nr:hypothetical protein QBC34DRAFT_414638 [Podospora aff. communis PSN243]